MEQWRAEAEALARNMCERLNDSLDLKSATMAGRYDDGMQALAVVKQQSSTKKALAEMLKVISSAEVADEAREYFLRLLNAEKNREEYKCDMPNLLRGLDHLRKFSCVPDDKLEEAVQDTTIKNVLAMKSLNTPQTRGGAAKPAKKKERKWEHVWKMIVDEKATKGIGKDQKIANKHNRTCAKRITDETCEKIDAEKVAQIRYEYSHPTRHSKQNHKKRS